MRRETLRLPKKKAPQDKWALYEMLKANLPPMPHDEYQRACTELAKKVGV